MPRTSVLPALLCSLSALLSPGLSAAAAGDASAPPSPTPPAAQKPKPAELQGRAGTKAASSMEVSVTKPKPEASANKAPSQAGAAAPPNSKPEPTLPAPRTALEAAVRAVVVLERAGKPLAVGTILNGDGRILTALSPLTHGNQIDARYVDGRLVQVKLSNSDRAWDLALLEPATDGPRAGLKATHDAAPMAGSKLHLVSYVHDKTLGASDLTVKGQTDLHGGDSVELANALELINPKASDVGAPLLNDEGEVVAIVARACSASDKKACTMAPYGAPVSAIRGFLRGVPPARRGPWVGVETVAFDAGIARGLRVTSLAPSGPGARAGLHAGPPGIADVILGVDGVPVSSAEAFAEAVDNHTPDSTLHLLVLSEGRYREVPVVLRPPSSPPSPPNAPPHGAPPK